MKKWKILVSLLLVVLIVAGNAQAAKAVTDFKDLSPEHPYYSDVAWAVEKGIVSGYADGTFKPDKPVTRGEYAIFMHRLFGKDWFGQLEADYIEYSTGITTDIKKGTAYHIPGCFVEFFGNHTINSYEGSTQLFLVNLPLLRWEIAKDFGYSMHNFIGADNWSRYGNQFFFRDGLEYAKSHNLEDIAHRTPKGYYRPGIGEDEYRELRKFTYGGVAMFNDVNALPKFSDGNFRVNAAVTRAELMHVLRVFNSIYSEINAKKELIAGMEWLKKALGPIKK